MRVKYPHKVDWVFYYRTLSDPPLEGRISGSSKQDLVNKIKSQFAGLGIEVPDNMGDIVEHQICLRMPNPSQDCWNSGVGDEIHHAWMKPFLSKVSDAVSKVESGAGNITLKKFASTLKKKIKLASNCSSCGGTTVYVPGVNNLGRAGTLNKLSQ